MISVLPGRISGETYESMLKRLDRRLGTTIGRSQLTSGSARRLKFISPHEFVANLANPEWLSLRDLLERHTALSLVRPFLDADEAESITKRLADGLGVPLITSLLASHERHCPDCHREEVACVGDIGTRWFHQLRWITRCQLHQGLLNDSRTLPAGVFRDELLACALTLSRGDSSILNAVQRSTVWLVKANLPPLGRKRWQSFHREALVSRFGCNPKFGAHELYKIARLVSRRLTSLLWLPMLSHESNWVETIIRRPRSTAQPLYHLVLLRLCGETAATAVERILSQQCTQPICGSQARQLELRFDPGDDRHAGVLNGSHREADDDLSGHQTKPSQ